MIINFNSSVLEKLWTTGDISLLPNAYVHEVVEILTIMDAAEKATDLALLGGFKIDEYAPDNWAVTITVNSVEPVGSITCYFTRGNAHDVDLNEYD
ncbi:hypothetical protein [Thalassomonas actiniarum]|uniref:Uncharacterized protein n=1 Tax=Thalassomonas actiniarum TaxID=485447 RepID=A0AAE9YPU6_9GAMM|nr:hypothetical protein [Thalassomonas actiniarum]WDD98293.1 hypothetical protein SG35_023940 [Thalassomonas actiniarum]